MKKIISLILILLMIFSIAACVVSCGDDPEPPIEIDKNPSGGDETGDTNGDSSKDEEENTWMDPDADWNGRPVTLPSN